MKMSPIAALALTAISLGYASAESRSPNNIQTATRAGRRRAALRRPQSARRSAVGAAWHVRLALFAGRSTPVELVPEVCDRQGSLAVRRERGGELVGCREVEGLVRLLEGGAELKTLLGCRADRQPAFRRRRRRQGQHGDPALGNGRSTEDILWRRKAAGLLEPEIRS